MLRKNENIYFRFAYRSTQNVYDSYQNGAHSRREFLSEKSEQNCWSFAYLLIKFHSITTLKIEPPKFHREACTIFHVIQNDLK